MPKRSRPTYHPEFRLQMVALVRAGRSPESLSREFEPSAQTIRTWVRHASEEAGERPAGLPTPERAKLAQLERELAQVKLERDILSKAAAWFARETGTIPRGSTGS